MTELVLIIDRSGAMSGLEGDTIGGFNAVIHRLRPPKNGFVEMDECMDGGYSGANFVKSSGAAVERPLNTLDFFSGMMYNKRLVEGMGLEKRESHAECSKPRIAACGDRPPVKDKLRGGYSAEEWLRRAVSAQ